ncbi:MAG: hypothetical protein QOC94_3515 [Actinoplanes sp.]|jgi:hypothetical protein|nr:hypothetical protein [Actinoplanes sp.]
MPAKLAEIVAEFASAPILGRLKRQIREQTS